MKTVITGSRTLVNPKYGTPKEVAKQEEWLHAILKEYFFMPRRTMINGDCPSGIDYACKLWVNDHNSRFIKHGPVEEWFKIDLELYPADWKAHGRGAGFIRNGQMAEIADTCLALWDGKSRGTRDMIDRCLTRGISTHVFVYKG